MAETDDALRRLERDSVIACAALAAAAAVLTRRLEPALGVIGGGALAAVSYQGIKAGISGLVKFFTRYAILAVGAYVIMARLRLPPVAVIAGASSFVIAVMFEALRDLSHSRR